MTVSLYSSALKYHIEVDRVIGRYSTGQPGPLLVVLAGIHGNEASGVFAFKRVLDALYSERPALAGEVLGLAGNLPALVEDVRYIDEDLNRLWRDERLNPLKSSSAFNTVEEAELIALIKRIEMARKGADRCFFVDCHTTSSETQPFISVSHDEASLRFASRFPVFTVVGLGDCIIGASDRYLVDHGFVGFTFEGGSHYDIASVENHEAVIWLALHHTGCLRERARHYQEVLAKTVIEGRKRFAIEYVHRIAPEHTFRMREGFLNFQKIKPGELLAWENGEPLYSRWDARLFMPLYQKLGKEGFVIIREQI